MKPISKTNERKGAKLAERYLWLFLLFTLSLSVVLGILLAFLSPVDGDDASVHLHWISGFANLLREGIWLPQWLPDGFLGFGSPVFYFYPPLTYYVASLISVCSGVRNPEILFNWTGLFATLLSGVSCFWFLLQIKSEQRNALIGALFFAFAPYRIFDLYTRSSISQHFAFIFVPLLAGALTLAYEHRDRLTPPVLLALSWAGLLLSSLPLSAAIAVVILLLGVLLYRSLTFKLIAQVVGGLVLGLILSAYHYVPAAYYRNYIQPSQFFAVGTHNWLTELLNGKNLRFDLISFLLFGTHASFLTVYILKKTQWKRTPLLHLTAALFAVFLLLETPFLSTIIWNSIAPLRFIQFYTRFGIVTLLLLSVLLARNLPIARRLAVITASTWSVAAIALSTIILGNLQLHSHTTNLWKDSPEYLPSIVDATQAMDSLLIPHERDSYVVSDRKLQSNESLSITLFSPIRRVIHSQLSDTATLTFHQFAWPAWEISLNGKLARTVSDSTGRVKLKISSGSSIIELKLVSNVVERNGLLISLLGLLVLVGFGLRNLLLWLRPKEKWSRNGTTPSD